MGSGEGCLTCAAFLDNSSNAERFGERNHGLPSSPEDLGHTLEDSTLPAEPLSLLRALVDTSFRVRLLTSNNIMYNPLTEAHGGALFSTPDPGSQH